MFQIQLCAFSYSFFQIENFVTQYSKNIPFERAFRRPNLTLTSNSFMHDYWVFISHLIPAYMSDFGLALIGQKPRVVNVYKNIHKMLSSIEYLTEYEWKCSYDSVIALRNSTIETDSQVKLNLNSTISIKFVSNELFLILRLTISTREASTGRPT